MIADRTHLDWQPVILLKVVRLPFSAVGGLSVKRAYIALDEGRLLYADWTLEASERCELLVCSTGWVLTTPFHLPVRLSGKGMHLIPAGTWLLPYTDSLFMLYRTTSNFLSRLTTRIDQQPIDPAMIATLIRFTHLL